MPKYQTVTLTNQDYEVMVSLEKKIGKNILLLDQGSYGDHIKSDTFGFIPLNAFINSLGLYNCKFDNFPEEIVNLVNIRHLSLSTTNIHNISGNIDALVNLEKLLLPNNQITTIPKEIFNLMEVSVLDLSQNKINILSQEISKLDLLRRLLISNNNLRTIPESISNLKNLQKLDLSFNLIDKLPEFIFNLKNLKQLIVTGNPFDTDWLNENKDIFNKEMENRKSKIIW
ncbi:MAG: leucine-rich repeat domain-containing protein [Candidatus Hodarchaeales archaeon]|jgi:Leucine-rich repeat (LRR) protein